MRNLGFYSAAALVATWLAFLLPLASAQTEAPYYQRVEEGEAFPIELSGPRYERGYLFVPQSADPDDPLILKLPVIRIRALEPNPVLAPVLFLPGGPGVGSLRAAFYPGAYPGTQTRDFIILGRRGTRYAEPSLRCEPIGQALVDAADTGMETLQQAFDACQSTLFEQGVRLGAYHSAASASDIEALRAALGLEQVSIFALSYGTRLALTYARDYPGRVQSMVLEAPLPHNVRFDDSYSQNLRLALERVTQICAEQEECARAFPDLGDRFFSAIQAAPRECEPGRQTVCQADIVDSVPLGSPDDLVWAPLRMEQALARQTPPKSGARGVPSDFDWGVRLSVWCSEALPHAQRWNGPLDDSFAGLDAATFLPDTCRSWGAPVRPLSDRAVTVSDAPTLILAGELDILTPPDWGYEAARTLNRSRVISIPYGFHSETTNWDGDGCAMSLAVRFFSTPDEMIADTSLAPCIEARAEPAFITR